MVGFNFICIYFLVLHVPEKMKFPVTAYVVVIGSMVHRALNRNDPNASTKAHWISAVGAVIFAFSDFILAYDKFVYRLENARWAVMLAYVSFNLIYLIFLVFWLNFPHT